MFLNKHEDHEIKRRNLRVQKDASDDTCAVQARSLAIELEFDNAETMSYSKLVRELHKRGFAWSVHHNKWIQVFIPAQTRNRMFNSG